MKEYGGCIPLELNIGQEFDYHGFDVVALNSGRSAISYAAISGEFEIVYIPYYTCKSVEASLFEHGIEVRYYNIDEHFMPENVPDPEAVEKDNRERSFTEYATENDSEVFKKIKEEYSSSSKKALFVYTNYFGIMTKEMQQQILSKYENVLFDNTQGFFTEPVHGAYNAYSCRKFFGVPDGAYLVADDLKRLELELDESSVTANYLLKAIEYGPNAAYADSKENEERINNSGMKFMSKLTETLMNNINQEAVDNRRQINFTQLHNMLKDVNKINPILENGAPMVYPLLVKSDTLRQHLIDNKVFVPTWWRWILESEQTNEFEKELAKYLIPLPINQYYTVGDMMQIAKIVKAGIN